MPRAYRLGERAVQMEATRARIIEAAIELYTEVGISRTTMREVVERADVAPGTLRNHFPSRADLDLAMVAHLTAEAPLPDLSIFDGARTVEERIGRLIRVTGAFLDQGARIYRMWQREPLLTGAWAEAGARYGAGWDQLMRTALGPLADDADAMVVLRAVLQPSFFGAVGAGSRTTDEISALVAAVITPWLKERAEGRER